jgi:hypothetical protein
VRDYNDNDGFRNIVNIVLHLCGPLWGHCRVGQRQYQKHDMIEQAASHPTHFEHVDEHNLLNLMSVAVRVIICCHCVVLVAYCVRYAL